MTIRNYTIPDVGSRVRPRNKMSKRTGKVLAHHREDKTLSLVQWDDQTSPLGYYMPMELVLIEAPRKEEHGSATETPEG